MLTITHTHEAGTIIEGTAKGDGTAEILKANRWRWGRSIGAWYIPQSRDRISKTWVIEPTVAALRAAGFTVENDICDELRSAAEVEAGRIERQEERAAALSAKADRRQAAADAADANLSRRMGQLPPMGEPVKIGHHSEGRHRAALKRADSATRRAIEASDAASKAADRAETAAQTTDRRYAPRAVARRIERLKADIRHYRRQLDGSSHTFPGGYVEHTPPATGEHRERFELLHAEVVDQLAYWEKIRAQQIASGAAGDYSPSTISKGDKIQYMGRWNEVVRVNPKSVSVLLTWNTYADGSPMRGTVPYGDIQGHRPAA